MDTWTETVEEDEYVRMLQKIILGTMYLQDDALLKWKLDKDISYDSFFAFMEHEVDAQRREESEMEGNRSDESDLHRTTE